jgi:hypothetical protein
VVSRSDSFSVGPLASDIRRVTIQLSSGQRVEGAFKSSDTIDFRIEAPGGQVLQGKRSVGDLFQVTATVTGTYALVFDNSFVLVTSKQVQLQYLIHGSS